MPFLDRLRVTRRGGRADIIDFPGVTRAGGTQTTDPGAPGDASTLPEAPSVTSYEQAMVRLREDHPPAPSELVDDILAYVFSVSEEDLPEQKLRIRWFLIGGAVAATVVLAVVGVVLLRRGWVPGTPAGRAGGTRRRTGRELMETLGLHLRTGTG
ncbi:MAG: hypothetical protein IT198_09860 [Acidimicrobiia bacterium]|nr:hypothetical protein [Acidimicrobiia bacterium]